MAKGYIQVYVHGVLSAEDPAPVDGEHLGSKTIWTALQSLLTYNSNSSIHKLSLYIIQIVEGKFKVIWKLAISRHIKMRRFR